MVVRMYDCTRCSISAKIVSSPEFLFKLRGEGSHHIKLEVTVPVSKTFLSSVVKVEQSRVSGFFIPGGVGAPIEKTGVNVVE